MKFLLPVIIFLLLLSSCVSPKDATRSVTAKQSNRAFLFYETKKNTGITNAKKIVIVGAGSLETRMFLDNLTDKLNTTLQSSNVGSVYYYLGNSEPAARAQLNNVLKKENYDLLLQFHQVDSSRYPVKTHQAYTAYNASIKYRTVKYKQNFELRIFNNTDLQHSLWEAALSLNFNFTNAPEYRNITNSIVKSLQNNKLVN